MGEWPEVAGSVILFEAGEGEPGDGDDRAAARLDPARRAEPGPVEAPGTAHLLPAARPPGRRLRDHRRCMALFHRLTALSILRGSRPARKTATEEIKMTGLRRRIAGLPVLKKEVPSPGECGEQQQCGNEERIGARGAGHYKTKDEGRMTKDERRIGSYVVQYAAERLFR